MKIACWVTGLVWGVLSLNMLLCVALFQANILTWDQWDYFAPLFNGGGWMDLFTYQHGPHRQGLGFVVSSWILHLTQWDQRFDALWIALLLSISSALALRLKWKITGTLQLKDAWIPVVGLTLGQFEAFLITPNASHSAFPLALTMTFANLWLTRFSAVRFLGGGLFAVGLTFTGFGLFAGAIITVLLAVAFVREAFQREWKSSSLAFAGAAIAILGWVWFFSGYVFTPAVLGFRFPWTPATDYLRFIALMLLEPAGVRGESAIHYAAGGFLALLMLVAVGIAVWKWIRPAQRSPADEVILLLVGAGFLFVCNTAIGRVCLSITGGMCSRYITLMFPLWLGIYLTGVQSNNRSLKLVTFLAVSCLALWPYRDMPFRPLDNWVGTLGATHAQYAYFDHFTSKKAAWVDAYLKSGSWEAAQQTQGTRVHPAPASTRINAKLEFLKERELMLFAGEQSYLPLLLRSRTIWNDEFPALGKSRALEGDTVLTYVTSASGFAEIKITTNTPPSGAPVYLDIEYQGKTRSFTFERLPVVFAVPVEAGFNFLTFRAAAASGTPSTEGTKMQLTASAPVFRTTLSAESLAF